jgi:peptidoglycan/xylan/chitin deacetylase (PgdA/CDA1 family)
MVEIKRKIKWFAGLIAIIPFCIIVTFAFWSTSGGWTETYLKYKINDKILKDDKFIFNGIDNVIAAKTNDYPMVVQAPPFEYSNNYDIDVIDDRYNRKDIIFNKSVNKRVFIIRLDDVQTVRWNDITTKIIDSTLERNMSMTLGVIPSEINTNTSFFKYLRNVSKDERIEIAQHGTNHSLKEYSYINESEAFKLINSSIYTITKITGKYPITFIPPNNQFDEINATEALSRLGFRIISSDYDIFGHTGHVMNIGYSEATVDRNYNITPVKEVIDGCSWALNKTRVCVILVHPQDYENSDGLLDTEKFNNYIELLDSLKDINATSITFADLGKEEFTEGGYTDYVKNLKIQQYFVKELPDYVYSSESAPPMPFGSSDCERLRILNSTLPLDNYSQVKRNLRLIDSISSNYGRNINDMFEYCKNGGYNMSDMIT